MVDPSNLAAVFADDVKMRELVQNIQKITDSVSTLAEKLAGMERAVPATMDAAKDGVDDLNDSLRDTTDHMKDMVDLTEESFTRWQKWGQSLTGLFQGLGNAIQQTGNYMRNLSRDPAGQIMSSVGQIPYAGPLLQIALESQYREDSFKKAGRQANLQFQKTEGLDPSKVRETGAVLGTEMKRLEEGFLAKREDVQAVWAAFAEGGLKSRDVLQELDTELVSGFGKNLGATALGIDKAFGQAAGTTAQLSDTLRQNTNVSLIESVRLVKDLGLASHGTGQGMQAFINTILQTTSALRVQGGDARDLANTYFKLQETIKATAAPGTSAQRVSTLTGTAMGGLSQFVQSMPQGLQALVGADIAGQMHLKLSDIGSLRAFETGFQGQGGMKEEDFSKKASEMAYARLKAEGVNEGDDMYMALKAMGMSAQLADLLERAKGNLTGTGANAAAQEFEGKLKQVKDLQPLNVGDFEKVMEDIKKLMMSIGQLTIGLLGLIAQTLISSARVTLDSTYTRADALKDITGRAGQIATEGKHFGALSKQLLGDTGDAINVEGFLRPGSKTGEASIGERLATDAQIGMLGMIPGGMLPAAMLQAYRAKKATESNDPTTEQLPDEPSLEGLQSRVETKAGWLTVYLNPRVEFQQNRTISRGDMPEQGR